MRGLLEMDLHLMMAGRIPTGGEKLVRAKGKIRVGETLQGALGRLQAAMVKFGTHMVGARRAMGGMGLARPGGGDEGGEC